MLTLDDKASTLVYLVSFFIVYSFLGSSIGSNWSKVDQLWSITPIIYTASILQSECSSTWCNKRLFLFGSAIILWGVRLSYNFWRRGGYGNLITHEEDYRWEHVRAMIPKNLHVVFNLTFVATYQNVLLLLVCLPLYLVSQTRLEIDTSDLIIFAVSVALVLFETVADQQQWNFQSFKHSLTVTERNSHPSKSIREGFLQTGLFHYCRHPNYFAEQCFWFTIYTTSIRTHGWLNWSIVGVVLYLILFHFSIDFSESLTLKKYPKYKEYIMSTSRCIPWPKFRSKKAL